MIITLTYAGGTGIREVVPQILRARVNTNVEVILQSQGGISNI